MRKAVCDLASCFLCSHCLPEWKDLIALKKKTRRFRKGENIFPEGGRVEEIFFLVNGFVKVHKKWNDPKDIIVRFAQPGEMLGHRGLNREAIYPVSATALTDVVICFIPMELFDDTLQSNQGLTYRLMQFFSAELQRAETRMRDLVHMDVKGRISQSLFEMEKIFGTNETNQLRVPVSRQDIAAYSGTTYESLFRFFQELAAGGIISSEGKFLRIDKPRALRKFILVGK